MIAIFEILKWFAIALGTILALLIGTVLDPTGAINALVCLVIDIVTAVFPSTPDSLKIGSLLNSIGNTIPVVGVGIVYDLFSTAAQMLGIVLIIKVYKLIPFKMS
jgi:hypothetical protein